MIVFCSAGAVRSVIMFCHHSSLNVGYIFFRQAAQILLNAFFISYIITALQPLQQSWLYLKECGQNRQTPANNKGKTKRVIHKTGTGQGRQHTNKTRQTIQSQGTQTSHGNPLSSVCNSKTRLCVCVCVCVCVPI